MKVRNQIAKTTNQQNYGLKRNPNLTSDSTKQPVERGNFGEREGTRGPQPVVGGVEYTFSGTWGNNGQKHHRVLINLQGNALRASS
jgi:hypothetical protein